MVTLQVVEIQGDQKISVHLMITTQKVTSNIQSVPRQSPDTDTPNCVLEDRVQYSTVHIPNAFCDETVFFLCRNYQVQRDVLITLYNYAY